MSARAAILDRLRRAEQTGVVPASGDCTSRPAAANDTSEPLLERFVRELNALGVNAFVEPSDEAVRARVAGIVGSQLVLQWDSHALPYGTGALFPAAATGSSPREQQAAAEIGVTGVDAAIAETGSLAQLAGEGKPRAASLLPPTHLAIVRREQLCRSMGEFFAQYADALSRSACCTFITGPSRTADIELTLTLGVHGPGVVIVVVGP